MKKLLSIIILSLLFGTNISLADSSLIKIIDIYWKRIDDIKMNKVDTYSHLFLQQELKNASDLISEVGRPCYREVLIDKKNYDTSVNCLNFRILLGNDRDEWFKNLNKIKAIFEAQNYLADNTSWLEKWSDKDFNEFSKLGNEIVGNVSVASELIVLVTD